MNTRTLISGLVALFLIAACGGDEAVETTTTVPATTVPVVAPTTTSSSTAVPEPEFVWPLTGLPTDTDPVHAQMVIAKIDNTSNSRPQVGLGEADMVIEVPVEGGIPRFLAFFQSSIPAEIGPVRSTRARSIPSSLPRLIHYSRVREARVSFCRPFETLPPMSDFTFSDPRRTTGIPTDRRSTT